MQARHNASFLSSFQTPIFPFLFSFLMLHFIFQRTDIFWDFIAAKGACSEAYLHVVSIPCLFISYLLCSHHPFLAHSPFPSPFPHSLPHLVPSPVTTPVPAPADGSLGSAVLKLAAPAIPSPPGFSQPSAPAAQWSILSPPSLQIVPSWVCLTHHHSQ